MSDPRRQRGGTFTFVSLSLASLMLLSAGLLTGPAQTTLRSAAASLRRSELREAAFSGVRYVQSGASAPATLLLYAGEVRVERLPALEGRGVVSVVARNGLGETFALRCYLEADGRLASFEVVQPPH